MRLSKITWKLLAMLALAAVLFVPAALTSGEAQLFGTQFAQAGPGMYPTTQYPYSGGIYTQRAGLLPPDRCPAGYYFDTYSGQCVPPGQPFPYGGPRPCPDGYYYDQYRGQCVPYMTGQGYGYSYGY